MSPNYMIRRKCKRLKKKKKAVIFFFVNAGTKFIIRHSVTTRGRAHKETVCSAKRGERQRCTHLERKGAGSPLSEKGSKEAVKSFIQDSSLLAAKSLQSCPTLCNPTDDSPPGSPISGILQARTLEWVAISFSNA